MSHSPGIVDRVAAKLAAEYPPDVFTYVFEKAIPGTRMMPDILVTREGRAVCAVEIGYTRPEKLTAYREQLSIPDVRWYDKGGRLHADVTTKTVVIKTVVAPPHSVFVYTVHDRVGCLECDEEWLDAPRRVPDRCVARYVRWFGEEAQAHREEQIDHARCFEVITLAITDYCRIWFLNYCDKCDRSWLSDRREELDAEVLVGDFSDDDHREIARWAGPRKEVRWSWVQQETAARGLRPGDLDLAACFLDGYSERDFRAELHAKIAAVR